MKLKEGFLTQSVDNVQFLVPMIAGEFNGLVRSNETAAFIVNQLQRETTPEKIIDAMCAEYDTTREVIATDVLEILDRHKVHAEHISMGIDQFALVLSQTSIGDALYEIIGDIRAKCSPDDVSVQDNIALVAAVGRKMIFRPGISGKLFNALGKEGINIRTIAQGSDELAIIVGVDNSQFETTIRVLYHSFAG